MSRRRVRWLGVVSVTLVSAVLTVPQASGAVPELLGSADVAARPGLSRLLTLGSDSPRAIATFDSIPSAQRVGALRALGLTVQPMKHVPLAVVSGPVPVLRQAVALGFAKDVYPDDRIELLDTTSADVMGAAAPRRAGFTGKGVTVALVDSGCDASHPDLADHVAHNVKLISPEYVNQAPSSDNTLVIPMEEGPYQNTDLGSGHGTHVAGIIAADSTTDASRGRLGVAPDAQLVCYGIGEILFTTAVVTAYDHMLDQPNLWGIKVVNNSWGNSFRQFDPDEPVHVVTKAVADKGVTVVFAAGNSGGEQVEASQNPFSLAPWVTAVAAGTRDRKRGSFSSNGFVVDNSMPSKIGSDGHTSWTGDRIGVYHPDVTAPGVDISSTCDSAGLLIGPCPPPSYGNDTASGTSMASPHVAGAAAVLLQANPKLKPAQIRAALQATAKRMSGEPFWRVGYGYVNLAAAVKLVRSKGWAGKLAAADRVATKRMLNSDAFKVVRSDLWTYAAPPATVGTDTQRFEVAVTKRISHLKVVIAHPSLAVIGENGTKYTVTVKDAQGKLLGTTTEAPEGAGSGTAQVLINLKSARPSYGKFSFEILGDLAASDPDTIDSDSLLGRVVVLQVAQLGKTGR